MPSLVNRADFFKSMYAECKGKIELRAIAIADGKPPVRNFFRTTDMQGINTFCRKNQGCELYFGIATRDGQAGRKQNIVDFTAVYCDIDFKNTPIEKANESLKYFPIQPSIVVHSGGGYHVYWLFNEPLAKDAIEDIENILKRLAQYFEADMGSTDAAHVLRIPGTLNHKPDYAPRTPEVKVIKFEPQLTYELSDFAQYLPELKDSDSSGKAINPPGWEKEVVQGTTPGHRRPNLAKEAGRLIEKGLIDEEILPILLAIDKKNTPSVGKEQVIKTLKGIRTTDTRNHPTQNVAARIKEYLFDEFDGGVFRISDLRRELGLSDSQYTVARNCIKRMVDQGLVQKHGHQLGCYRVVDRKKKTINWAETEAQASNLLLPGNLHQIVTIRNGDLIAFAGFKNHNKTGIAIETVRLNLDNFKVHFFITEYKARMKRRLLDFGVDLNHPNFNAYQMDKTDYIPDKIESGPGVLNVIDHLPNLDNFYLVGKYQDEIHRALDGAICMITHQKLKPNDLDAIGKSFWRITPTLAVTLFWDDVNEYQGKMKIVKAKEPGEGRFNVNGLVLNYSLKRGREFKYDLEGWI